MTDACNFITKHPKLFHDKVKEVVVMGGVKVDGDFVFVNQKGFMEIDETASNNKFDLDAARELYQILQEMGVKMIISTRHAAKAAAMPKIVFEEMVATGHVIGTYMLDAQKDSINDVYRRVLMPNGAKGRDLPDRCDLNWFSGMFCRGAKLNPAHIKNAWDDAVKDIAFYDVIALASAIPSLNVAYFNPSFVPIRSLLRYDVRHEIIGVSSSNHEIKHPGALKSYFHSNMVGTLEWIQAYENDPEGLKARLCLN